MILEAVIPSSASLPETKYGDELPYGSVCLL
jgi:hypothetical protein